MNKLTILGSTLALALLSSATMAVDFYALESFQTAPAPVKDVELSSVEGGATCSSATIGVGSEGVALCSFISPGAFGGTASFVVGNGIPATGAPFLQTVE
ncbi:MAG: hypothetical protein V3V18_05975 [Methylococcales bacterium]